MDSVSISVTIPLDEHEFLDRQCHSDNCGRYFKVLNADWEKADIEEAVCPFCGHRDEVSEFNTDEQLSFVRDVALASVMGELQRSLSGLNRKFSSSGSFRVSIETKFSDLPIPVSPEAIDRMRLQIECDHCHATYAVVGAGFFCPLCGRNSAGHTFRQSIAKTRSALEVVRKLEDTGATPDEIAEARRDSLEGQVKNLVTAFQRYGEAVYPTLPNYPGSIPRNLFQRLTQASQKWAEAGGKSFRDTLDEREWGDLLGYFQQRHLLEHQDGFVDAEYVEKSGDPAYQVNQRIVVTQAQVLQMADLVEKLGTGMASDVPDQLTVADPPNENQNKALPDRIPGVTEEDWKVFRTICQAAVENDHNSMDGYSVWDRCKEDGVTESEFGDSIEILHSKSLIEASYTMDGRSIPRHLTLTQRGLELYFRRSQADYAQRRREIALQIIDGATDSFVLLNTTGLPCLLVHHVLRDFESRGWVGRLFATSGGLLIPPKSLVHLKREFT